MKLRDKAEKELNSILSEYYEKGYKDGFKSGCEGVINMAKRFKNEVLERIEEGSQNETTK